MAGGGLSQLCTLAAHRLIREVISGLDPALGESVFEWTLLHQHWHIDEKLIVFVFTALLSICCIFLFAFQ